MSDVIFDKDKILNWYNRKDIYLLITTYNDFKYITCMAYDVNGKSCIPRRFQSMAKTKYGYDWTLKFNAIGRKPTSIYRDVDSWKSSRPFFSVKSEIYKEQRKEFFANLNYRKHIYASDFYFDIDGEDVYESWEMAYKVVELLRRFNIMFNIFCTGKKGFQIFIPNHKAIKKEYIYNEGNEYNTHQILAFNIALYLNDDKKLIDMTAYSDLRFMKQPYSLDGRNMCPIMPLKYEEFLDFINYKDKYNPYTDIDYWSKKENFLSRGFCFQGNSDMKELEKYIDNWVDKQ